MDASGTKLFPIIGPTELREYIALGRASLLHRKTRQNQYAISYENLSKRKTPDIRSHIDTAPGLEHDKSRSLL